MARIAAGRKNRKMKTPSRNLTGKKGASETAQADAAQGSSFLKWFLILVVLLIGVDVFNSVKSGTSFFPFKGFQKHFLVQQVVRFTGTASTGKPMSANGVAVVGPNELAVADTSGNRILLFDFKGKLIREWGTYGSKGPYELHEPSAVVTDHKGHIFVMDTWNGAIKGYDLNGHSIGTIDLNHFASFYGPRNIAWGGNYFLVADVANYRLVKLSLDGKILSVLAGKGKGKGQFMGLNYVTVDPTGNWYVADASGNNRVEVFDNDGKFLREFKVRTSPNALALDGNGKLFVGSWGAPSKVFTTSGKYLGDLDDAAQPDVPINNIIGMDIAPDGSIVASGGDQVTIYRAVQDAKN